MAKGRGRVVPDVVFGAEVEGIGWVGNAWVEAGLPNCWWNRAPAGLATRRQLRERGLSPGGQEPVAVLRRRPAGYLHGYLYRLDLARPKRRVTAVGCWPRSMRRCELAGPAPPAGPTRAAASRARWASAGTAT